MYMYKHIISIYFLVARIGIVKLNLEGILFPNPNFRTP